MGRDGTWMCWDVVLVFVGFGIFGKMVHLAKNYFQFICLKMLFLLIVFRIYDGARLIFEFGP